jgi:hypothetical protein
MDEIVQAFKEAYPQKHDKTDTTIPGSVPADVNSNVNVTTTDPIPTPVVPDTSKDPVEIFDPSEFNTKYGKKFGREIKEEKELQELFSAPTKITEYENKVKNLESEHGLTKKQFEDLQAKYESEKESLKFVDLRKYVGEDLLRISEMRKKYPDKDISIMTSISNIDLDKADTVDLLIKQARLNDPDVYKGMDDSDVREVVADRFGSADLADPESWDNVTKAKIAKAGKEARIEFKALQDVELPATIDVEKERQSILSKEAARIEQSKQSWSPIVDKMVANFTELIIPDEDGKELYKYIPEIDDSFKKEMSEFVNFLAYSNQPINEDTLMNVLENMKGRYFAKNSSKIMKSHATQVATKLNDEWHAKVNNDVPLSDKTKPKSQDGNIWDKMAAKLDSVM